jgi:hypothetical protein
VSVALPCQKLSQLFFRSRTSAKPAASIFLRASSAVDPSITSPKWQPGPGTAGAGALASCASAALLTRTVQKIAGAHPEEPIRHRMKFSGS